MRPIRLLLSLVFVLLAACSSKPGLSSAEKNYYQTMSEVVQELKPIQTMSKSNKFAKVRFVQAIDDMTPKAQTLLKRFKGTEFANRDSYKALLTAFEDYVIAKHMWQQEKGLALVNQRLAEGSQSLQKAQNLLQQEKKPAQTKKK